jgi:hypothetical protein
MTGNEITVWLAKDNTILAFQYEFERNLFIEYHRAVVNRGGFNMEELSHIKTE